MGLIYADIELINGDDLALVRRNYLDRDEVRRIRLNVLVDTGSAYMCINENIQEFLKLPVLDRRTAQLADGKIVTLDLVGPLDICFQNRTCTVRAMVLPGDNEPLLGAIPMEDIDVVINVLRQELTVHPDHPDMAQMKLKNNSFAPSC